MCNSLSWRDFSACVICWKKVTLCTLKTFKLVIFDVQLLCLLTWKYWKPSENLWYSVQCLMRISLIDIVIKSDDAPGLQFTKKTNNNTLTSSTLEYSLHVVSFHVGQVFHVQNRPTNTCVHMCCKNQLLKAIYFSIGFCLLKAIMYYILYIFNIYIKDIIFRFKKIKPAIYSADFTDSHPKKNKCKIVLKWISPAHYGNDSMSCVTATHSQKFIQNEHIYLIEFTLKVSTGI